MLEAELKNKVLAAGFTDFKIAWRGDIFRDAPQQSEAAAFGTMGITFQAVKT